MVNGIVFLISLSVLSFLFDDGPSSKCVVISHCGFDLHFLNDTGHWAYFNVPVGLL